MNIEKLKEIRESKELTMLNLANILGISKSTYSLWEEGIERPPLVRVVEICDYFNISLDYLVDNTSLINYENSKNGIDKNIFSNNLKILRKEFKLTQEKLAKKLGLGRTTIINYEKGNTLPILDHLIYISKNYNISIDYLLGKINEPKYLK